MGDEACCAGDFLISDDWTLWCGLYRAWIAERKSGHSLEWRRHHVYLCRSTDYERGNVEKKNENSEFVNDFTSQQEWSAMKEKIEKNSCALCRLVFDNEIKTKLLHKDDTFTVTSCVLHKQPMAVLNGHRAKLTIKEEEQLNLLMTKLFPNLKRRGYMQSIKNHWHDHYV